jgi:hypothetical protein
MNYKGAPKDSKFTENKGWFFLALSGGGSSKRFLATAGTEDFPVSSD